MRTLKRIVAVMAASISLGGCIGKDSAGSFTVDNLGLNISTIPVPTMAVNYSRQEGAMEPAFENGTTPAVAAAIQHNDSVSLLKIADNVSSTFAGGNAAVLAAGEVPDNGLAAVACVAKAPNDLHKAGEAAPLLFVTDTAFGLNISFPASAAQPQIINANLGFKRYEVALSPVFQSPDGCKKQQLVDLAQLKVDLADPSGKPAGTGDPQTGNTGNAGAKGSAAAQSGGSDPAKALAQAQFDLKEAKLHDDMTAVYVPSTLAIANDNVGGAAGAPASSGTATIAQVFATGKAAEVIAKNNAFGVIGAVAATAKPSAGGGIVFTTAVAKPPVKGDSVRISPSFAINGKTIALGDTWSYDCKPTDTAASVAKGLATAINSNVALQLAGAKATANGAQITLSVPPNLAFLTNPLGWTPDNPTDGTCSVQKSGT